VATWWSPFVDGPTSNLAPAGINKIHPRPLVPDLTTRALGVAVPSNYFLDHPLPAEYLFTDDEVASGALHSKVAMILDDPDRHFANQRYYRDAILLEQERFDVEVRTFFFSGA
jgi:hypothetical protein